jgi:hypothetical protein
MPNLHDTPPSAVQADIDSLRHHLVETLPSKRLDENLLIATWNLRAFSSLTRKWTAGEDDSPKRDLRGLRAIGEIVRRFDIIARRRSRVTCARCAISLSGSVRTGPS